MQLTASTSSGELSPIQTNHDLLVQLKEILVTDQWQLCELAFELMKREIRSGEQLADYSFVVFPIAKAYEGFLKEYLRTMTLIDDQTYRSRRFRIGRALNPDLFPQHQNEHWLYDDVARRCGPELARELWQTWLECRNHVFHYFPDHQQDNFITLTQAQEKVELISQSMLNAWECVLDERGKS
jgi:hypothetical protein